MFKPTCISLVLRTTAPNPQWPINKPFRKACHGLQNESRQGLLRDCVQIVQSFPETGKDMHPRLRNVRMPPDAHGSAIEHVGIDHGRVQILMAHSFAPHLDQGDGDPRAASRELASVCVAETPIAISIRDWHWHFSLPTHEGCSPLPGQQQNQPHGGSAPPLSAVSTQPQDSLPTKLFEPYPPSHSAQSTLHDQSQGLASVSAALLSIANRCHTTAPPPVPRHPITAPSPKTTHKKAPGREAGSWRRPSRRQG